MELTIHQRRSTGSPENVQLCDWRFRDFSSDRINLLSFTKDFRGESHCKVTFTDKFTIRRCHCLQIRSLFSPCTFLEYVYIFGNIAFNLNGFMSVCCDIQIFPV